LVSFESSPSSSPFGLLLRLFLPLLLLLLFLRFADLSFSLLSFVPQDESESKRVVGVLLGETRKGRLDVTSSFAVPFEEDENDTSIWFLDHSYLEKMCNMFRRINGTPRPSVPSGSASNPCSVSKLSRQRGAQAKPGCASVCGREHNAHETCAGTHLQ